MASKVKEEAIRDLIKVEKPSTILLQETKLSEEGAISTRKKLWKNNNSLAVG